jgi:formylglycine-generating enzyme required for sulfatase activity
VAEWVEDPFLDRYAACEPPCLDPVAPLPASPGSVDGTAGTPGTPIRRVIRGGDWNQIGPNCRSAGRSRWRQDEGLKNVGFRCAASAK